jgi:hypothetical protein
MSLPAVAICLQGGPLLVDRARPELRDDRSLQSWTLDISAQSGIFRGRAEINLPFGIAQRKVTGADSCTLIYRCWPASAFRGRYRRP